MIKSFRRNKRASSDTKHVISRVASQSTLDEESVLHAPRIVIKAIYDYTPQGPDELAFKKGDFFHVLPDADPQAEASGWYEATNPMTNQRGMVPASYFETFSRARPKSTEKVAADSRAEPVSPPNKRTSAQTLYAVTLYDFHAERSYELDVVAGENLIICAHHDYEWFIAKPINRLGGPGLVPVAYVKIIDLVNPHRTVDEADIVKLIENFKIPSVDQWKLQTAKYQAASIPLGSIANAGPAVSSHSQYFQKEASSNRSSLSSTNTTILEASVDAYQLDHGRYQYLVIAKLSNGKVRYLYRYYQDFYDLQVKLLELFPYEAGKIENSKRIIPSIPGPLINVNDSISKLRREKLDYYLRNLIALPPYISRSEEVLRLFEVLNNSFDKEVVESIRRVSKPVSQKSNYQHDRMSEYSNLPGIQHQRNSTTPSSSDSNAISRPLSQTSGNVLGNVEPNKPSTTKIKVKFYYQDDIFVLLLPSNLRLQDLKSKLYKRLNLNETSENSVQDIQLFLKNDIDEFNEEHSITGYEFNADQKLQIRSFEIDDDDKFHDVLYDKCKLCILA